MTPHDPDEAARLRDFLRTELAAFERVKGPTDKIKHTIRMKTDRPIKQRYRPRNSAMQKIIDEVECYEMRLSNRQQALGIPQW